MTRIIRAASAMLLVALAGQAAQAATARDMYEAAATRARTLREAPARGDEAATVRQFLAGVAAFEAIVRRHPTSGYCDNALMEGALLALDAQRRFGDERAGQAAARLLTWLVKEYPTSQLVAKARESLKRLPDSSAPPDRPTVPAVVPAARAAQPVSAAPPDAPPAAAPAGSPVRDDADTQGGGRTPLVVIRDVRRTLMGEVVRVTIELDDEVTYRTERLENPPRVLFDFSSTRPGPAVLEGTLRFNSDVVRQIRIGRHPNRVTRVVLDLDGVTKYSVFPLYNPYRLVVDCERPAPLPTVPSQRITEDRIQPPPADPETPILYRPTPRRATTESAPRPAAPLPGRVLRVTSRTIAPQVGLRPSPDFEVPAEAARPLFVTSRTMAPAVGARTTPLEVASAAPTLIATRRFMPTRRALVWLPVVERPAPLPWPPAPPERFAAAPERPVEKPVERLPQKAADKPAERAVEKAAERSPDKPIGKPSDPPAPLTPSQPLEVPPAGFSMARQLGLGASRIVIDPGHGGHDPGAGGTGLFESTIVLDVALRLEKLLRAAGSDVVLTRRTDEYIALEERTAMANRAQGDLFLSIHANASRNRSARGVESYFLNFATTPDAEAVAARENASTGRTMSSLTDIVKAITLNNKLDESKNFARIVQRELVSHLQGVNPSVRDHGVKQAPFVVLIGASMPSVLVEISFITNSQEVRLLKTTSYRQKIAEALLDAVRGYQRSLKGAPVLAQQ